MASIVDPLLLIVKDSRASSTQPTAASLYVVDSYLAPTTVPSLLLTGKASDTDADVKFDRNQSGLNSLLWCSSDEKLYHASVSNFASC